MEKEAPINMAATEPGIVTLLPLTLHWQLLTNWIGSAPGGIFIFHILSCDFSDWQHNQRPKSFSVNASKPTQDCNLQPSSQLLHPRPQSKTALHSWSAGRSETRRWVYWEVKSSARFVQSPATDLKGCLNRHHGNHTQTASADRQERKNTRKMSKS